MTLIGNRLSTGKWKQFFTYYYILSFKKSQVQGVGISTSQTYNKKAGMGWNHLTWVMSHSQFPSFTIQHACKSYCTPVAMYPSLEIPESFWLEHGSFVKQAMARVRCTSTENKGGAGMCVVRVVVLHTPNVPIPSAVSSVLKSFSHHFIHVNKSGVVIVVIRSNAAVQCRKMISSLLNPAMNIPVHITTLILPSEVAPGTPQTNSRHCTGPALLKTGSTQVSEKRAFLQFWLEARDSSSSPAWKLLQPSSYHFTHSALSWQWRLPRGRGHLCRTGDGSTCLCVSYLTGAEARVFL